MSFTEQIAKISNYKNHMLNNNLKRYIYYTVHSTEYLLFEDLIFLNFKSQICRIKFNEDKIASFDYFPLANCEL